MNMAQARQPNKTLHKFEFRGMAPTFVDQTLDLLVKDESANSLEARNHLGALIMSASAEFKD
jgi:hydroxyacyl-ACP dehydratase HTD2-like protein with hotdog domain